jgi:hypothetical protein
MNKRIRNKKNKQLAKHMKNVAIKALRCVHAMQLATVAMNNAKLKFLHGRVFNPDAGERIVPASLNALCRNPTVTFKIPNNVQFVHEEMAPDVN